MKTTRYETLGGALVALLATRSFVWADLYTITLAGGVTLRLAAGDTDWTYGWNTWTHGGPFIEHPDRKPTGHWKIGLDVDTWQFSVIPRPVDPLTGTVYPDTVGSVPWLAAARAGALDGAIVQVDRAYLAAWPTYPRPLALAPTGVVNIFTGRVAAIDVDRSAVMISLNSHLELLDQNMPRNLYQAGCSHVLFDAGCGLTAASYATSLTANSGSTQSTILATGSAPPGSVTYALGRILFTGGLNAGYSRSVRVMSIASGVVTLSLIAPMPFAVAAGDRLSPGGVDCATLLAQTFEMAGLIAPVPIPSYPPNWHMHRKTERYADTVLERAREVLEADALPGDVVMFQFGHSYSHAAIIMPPGWPAIVHAFFGSRLVQADHGNGGVLADRPRRFFTVW